MSGELEWGATPAVSGGPTLRRTRSNRILYRYGNRYSADFRMSDGFRRKLRAVHQEWIRRRYPMLGQLEMEYTWGGVFCMTRDWASFFGRLEPGEFAVGSESDLNRDVQALSGPKPLPPEPFLGLGVRARLRWYHWRSRVEW